MRSASCGCSPVVGRCGSDPRRQAVLLIAGDKTGDDRFYDKMVPVADDVFDAYLAEQAAGRHPRPDDEEG